MQHTIGEATTPGPAGAAQMNPDMGAYGWARDASQIVHLLRWRPPMYPGEEGMVVEVLGVLPAGTFSVDLAAPGSGGEMFGTAHPLGGGAVAPWVFHAVAGAVAAVGPVDLVGGATAALADAPFIDRAGNRFGVVRGTDPSTVAPVVWRRDPTTGLLAAAAEPLPVPLGAANCWILDANGEGVAVGVCGARGDFTTEPANGAERGVLWRLTATGVEVETVAGARPSVLRHVRPDGVAVGSWLRTDDVVDHPMLFVDGVGCDLWRAVVPGHGLAGYIELIGVSDDGSLLFEGLDRGSGVPRAATLMPVHESLVLSGPAPAVRGVAAEVTAVGALAGHDLWLYVSAGDPQEWTSWSVPECPGVVLPFDPVGAPIQPTAVVGDAATFAWTPPAVGAFPVWARVVDRTACEASQTHPLVVAE